MESVEQPAAGEEAPAGEGYVSGATKLVGDVVYPEDVAEGSPAWHAATAATSAAEYTKAGAAQLDEKFAISQTAAGYQQAASDKLAEIDAQHKVAEKAAYAYEQTKNASIAAAEATAAQWKQMDETHDISGRTAAALAEASSAAGSKASAIDADYKISETAAAYDAHYGVSEKTAAAAQYASLMAMSAHGWWTGKGAAAAAEPAAEEAPAQEVAAE